MKKCPYCAEEIQEEAIKCRYCGEFLDGQGPPRRREDKLPWHFRTSTIVIGLLCVGPFALPLLWWRPDTHWAWKVGLSVLVLAVSYFLTIAFLSSLHTIQDYYKLIQEM